MFEFLRKLRKPKRVPKIGEKWKLDDCSPWETPYTPWLILDVKDGWVKFAKNRAGKHQTETVACFAANYKPVDGENNDD